MDQLLQGLFETAPQEISRNLKAMSKTQNLEEKKLHSEIILNLCKSLGVFVDTISKAPVGMDADVLEMDEDMFDFGDPPLELHDSKKSRGRQRKKR